MLGRLTILMLCVGALAAADWPQWRGPDRNGVAKDSPELIDSLPKELEAAWEVALPKTPKKPPYYGTPIGAGGVVYFHGTCIAEGADATAKKPELADLVIAVQLATGKELWRTLSPVGTESKQGAPNAPVIAGDRLIVLSANGTLRALALADGTELWAVPAKLDKRPGQFTSSPLVVDDKVIINDKVLKAFATSDGKELWTAKVAAGHTSPALWDKGGQPVILAGDKTLAAVNAADGKTLWSIEPGKGGASSIVVAGNRMIRLIDGTGYRVWDLSADGAEEVTTITLALAGGGHNANTPAVDGDKVYLNGKEEVVCYDLTKKDFAWKGPKTGDAKPSPIVAGGKVLFGGKGKVSLFDTSGKALGTAKIPMAGCSSFALIDGFLVAQGDNKLRAFKLAK